MSNMQPPTAVERDKTDLAADSGILAPIDCSLPSPERSQEYFSELIHRASSPHSTGARKEARQEYLENRPVSLRALPDWMQSHVLALINYELSPDSMGKFFERGKKQLGLFVYNIALDAKTSKMSPAEAFAYLAFGKRPDGFLSSGSMVMDALNAFLPDADPLQHAMSVLLTKDPECPCPGCNSMRKSILNMAYGLRFTSFDEEDLDRLRISDFSRVRDALRALEELSLHQRDVTWPTPHDFLMASDARSLLNPEARNIFGAAIRSALLKTASTVLGFTVIHDLTFSLSRDFESFNISTLPKILFGNPWFSANSEAPSWMSPEGSIFHLTHTYPLSYWTALQRKLTEVSISRERRIELFLRPFFEPDIRKVNKALSQELSSHQVKQSQVELLKEAAASAPNQKEQSPPLSPEATWQSYKLMVQEDLVKRNICDARVARSLARSLVRFENSPENPFSPGSVYTRFLVLNASHPTASEEDLKALVEALRTRQGQTTVAQEKSMKGLEPEGSETESKQTTSVLLQTIPLAVVGPNADDSTFLSAMEGLKLQTSETQVLANALFSKIRLDGFPKTRSSTHSKVPYFFLKFPFGHFQVYYMIDGQIQGQPVAVLLNIARVAGDHISRDRGETEADNERTRLRELQKMRAPITLFELTKTNGQD